MVASATSRDQLKRMVIAAHKGNGLRLARSALGEGGRMGFTSRSAMANPGKNPPFTAIESSAQPRPYSLLANRPRRPCAGDSSNPGQVR
jgi:hypothetical protein